MYLSNFRSLFLDATKFKLRHVLKTFIFLLGKQKLLFPSFILINKYQIKEKVKKKSSAER